LFHPIANIEDAQTLAQAIVNTIVEPFLVLDEQFHVLVQDHQGHLRLGSAYSRFDDMSFHQQFSRGVEPLHGLVQRHDGTG